MRRMSAGSVRCAISPLVSNSGAENAPVCASRFLLWRRNCTPSTDSNITSASLARTGEKCHDDDKKVQPQHTFLIGRRRGSLYSHVCENSFETYRQSIGERVASFQEFR